MPDPAQQATKRCSRCGEVRSLTDFYADKRRSDGRRSDCRACNRVEGDARQAAPRGRALLADRMSRYYQRNRDLISEKRRLRYAARKDLKQEASDAG